MTLSVLKVLLLPLRPIIFMLNQDVNQINGEIFNSGSPENVYQLKPLAEILIRLNMI